MVVGKWCGWSGGFISVLDNGGALRPQPNCLHCSRGSGNGDQLPQNIYRGLHKGKRKEPGPISTWLIRIQLSKHPILFGNFIQETASFFSWRLNLRNHKGLTKCVCDPRLDTGHAHVADSVFVLRFHQDSNFDVPQCLCGDLGRQVRDWSKLETVSHDPPWKDQTTAFPQPSLWRGLMWKHLLL